MERYEIQRISETYLRYVRKNYGNAYIVFYGYDEAISAKSNAYATRSKYKGSSQNVIVQEENVALYLEGHILLNRNYHFFLNVRQVMDKWYIFVDIFVEEMQTGR